MSSQYFPPISDWDDAYSNGKYIPDSDGIVDRWNEAASDFRTSTRAELDVRYGTSLREVFDLFLPDGEPKGLGVFIHGGYWLAFDKSSWSHLANGMVQRGWACMIPSYDLAPHVRISDMTRQVAEAIRVADVAVPGPIVITGHSAGGHLAMRMMCKDNPLGPETSSKVSNVLGISGLYDLRPLQKTGMNEDLKISDVEARLESPAFLSPIDGIKAHCWVGANERPEFMRQNAMLANIWQGHGIDMTLTEAPGKHHFNVIDDLARADSDLINALIGA